MACVDLRGWLAWAVVFLLAATASLRAELQVSPTSVGLTNPEDTRQLLVTAKSGGKKAANGSADLTRVASYEARQPSIAVVDSTGLVQAVSEGNTEVIVRFDGEEVRVPVRVQGILKPAPISFEHQLIPILTKAGCNAGGCHGKAEGQNGFKLSVFGFDPWADYQALIMEGRGRRALLTAPDQSLLLRKATAEMPHGGGRKILKNSLPYQRLRRWLAEGAPFEGAKFAPVSRIVVEPEQQMLPLRGNQQLRVTAIDDAGNERCVTTEAEYSSNATTIADADRRGWVQGGETPGEAAILVRYMGNVTLCRITIPRPMVKFARPAENNFIDKLVWDKLERLGIPPSELAEDAAFMRRVYLDTIGTLPTAPEARAFLNDKRADKRARLINQVLQRPAYADYWAMIWSDILRVDKDMVTPQGAVAMTRWLRRQFADNRPYDQWVRDLLTIQGNTAREGPAAFYKVLNTPEVVARSFSQVFLGIRIECAQCHHHPSDRWGQEDYFALAGFFTGVGRKILPGGSEAIFVQKGIDLNHPRTSKPVPAKALGAAVADFSNAADRRTVLADWVTGPDNPYFARALANRLWAHYFGRGLVEPIDDLRATNPATNEPLLAKLADHLREVKYDIKAFTRTLLSSRAYQLASHANSANADDEQNFSHAAWKSMPAEVLLDAICQVTGVPEKYIGWPENYRAIQVWDNRMPSYFFRIFGRPVRYSVCECERSNEPSIAQALHLMNSPEIMTKIRSRRGQARTLADSEKPPREVIEELYLATLARFPTDKERDLMLDLFNDGNDRRSAVEDVLWALVNLKEFVYNH